MPKSKKTLKKTLLNKTKSSDKISSDKKVVKTKSSKEFDVIIIGGGSTGFSAAMYAGRLNMKTLVLAETIGGTLATAGSIENWPGIKKVDGFDLAMQIKEHAEEYNITLVEKRAIKAERIGDFFLISTEDEIFEAKSLIFATGTTVRKLNIPGETEYANKGVHYCALCDGPLYKNKVIGVIGGSDSAAKESLVLAEFASKVYIIYRGDTIHPEPINMARVEANKKVEIIYQTNLKEIKGDGKKVTSVTIDRSYKNSTDLKLDGVFVEIGHIPRSDLAGQLGVELTRSGEIMIDRDSKTNIPGIFAAGDITDTKFKQAITGAAEGVHAAYSAHMFVGGSDVV